MSMFGSIMSAIFRPSAATAPHGAPQSPAPNPAPNPAPSSAPGSAPAVPGSASGSAPASAPTPAPGRPDTAAHPPSGATAPATAAAAPAPDASGVLLAHEHVDVEAVLNGLAADTDEDLDWRRSIVDLMKLLRIDSSLAARKDLARELHYEGDMGDSAAMNVWLHRQVMKKLAANGGKVPADLLREDHHAMAK